MSPEFRALRLDLFSFGPAKRLATAICQPISWREPFNFLLARAKPNRADPIHVSVETEVGPKPKFYSKYDQLRFFPEQF